MTLLSQVFDIYIDLNITFAMTALVWLGAKALMERSGTKLAFNVQLGLLNGLFAVIVVSPVLVTLYRELVSNGLVSPVYAINLSDFAVSQYLRGDIAIPAEDFQALLGLRARLTQDILSLGSITGVAVVSFLMVGGAILCAKLLRSFVQLHRMLASCHEWRCHGRVQLLLSDTALVPFSARGLFKHYVVVPSELLASPDDLKLVLKHELEHVRQGDVTWEIGLELLRPFFFWNPFFYVWKSEVERLRELACDQKVTERAHVDLKSYCLCLMRAAQAGLRKRHLKTVQDRSGFAAVALIEVQDRFLRRSPAQKLRRRVEALLEPGRVRPRRTLVAAVVLPLVAVVFTTALAIQKPADWSHDRLMLSTIINLERLDAINSFGKPPLR